VLGLGALLAWGGYSKYSDQNSGVAGKARVTSCTRGYNTRYVHKASTCTGTWVVGGDLVFGNGHLSVGRIEGADAGDVGKTIDVRIHGTDHATVPGLGTPIMLWALGGVLVVLALFGLWKWVRAGRAVQT